MIHETWFWLLIILSPVVTTIATLARLARRSDLPPRRASDDEVSGRESGDDASRPEE
jgi:hypothetical protein